MKANKEACEAHDERGAIDVFRGFEACMILRSWDISLLYTQLTTESAKSQVDLD